MSITTELSLQFTSARCLTVVFLSCCSHTQDSDGASRTHSQRVGKENTNNWTWDDDRNEGQQFTSRKSNTSTVCLIRVRNRKTVLSLKVVIPRGCVFRMCVCVCVCVYVRDARCRSTDRGRQLGFLRGVPVGDSTQGNLFVRTIANQSSTA